MDKDTMLRIYHEISIAASAVETAQIAIHKATRGYSGCQLPSGAYGELGQVYMMLIQERDALAEELAKEAA